MKLFLRHCLLIGCGSIASSLGAAAAFAADAPLQADHQAAVWQERQYSFTFLGFTSTYSCDGLADKLKILLRAAGARGDVRATAGACANGFGRPDKFARADLKFYVLVPGGAGSVSAADSVQGSVDGSWLPVQIATHIPREVGLGDCELVEQFKNNVLPLFTMRNEEQHTTCIPYQDSGSVIDLKFESLSAVSPLPTRP